MPIKTSGPYSSLWFSRDELRGGVDARPRRRKVAVAGLDRNWQGIPPRRSKIVTKTMWLALLAVCLFQGSCRRPGRSDIVKAGGTVTYHNQPLADVSVTFLPEHGRPANGTTDAAGRFTLSTSQRDDGCGTVLPGDAAEGLVDEAYQEIIEAMASPPACLAALHRLR